MEQAGRALSLPVVSINREKPFVCLIYFPIHIDTFCILSGKRLTFLNHDVCVSIKVVKVVLILANSADSDEMQHYAAFYLGLHYLPKCLLRGFQYTKISK